MKYNHAQRMFLVTCSLSILNGIVLPRLSEATMIQKATQIIRSNKEAISQATRSTQLIASQSGASATTPTSKVSSSHLSPFQPADAKAIARIETTKLGAFRKTANWVGTSLKSKTVKLLKEWNIIAPSSIHPEKKKDWRQVRTQLAFAKIIEQISKHQGSNAYGSPQTWQSSKLSEIMKERATLSLEEFKKDASLTDNELKLLENEAEWEKCAIFEASKSDVEMSADEIAKAVETVLNHRPLAPEEQNLENARDVARNAFWFLFRTPKAAFDLARSCNTLFWGARDAKIKSEAARESSRQMQIKESEIE